MRVGRAGLLGLIVDEVAQRGMGDRSLRELAEAIGTSHRMLLYHFGSRSGLVEAIVGEMEEREQAFVREVAATAQSPADLLRALWRQLTSPEVLPFVRLFFEVVAVTSRRSTIDLTSPYLADAGSIAKRMGSTIGPDEARVGIAVVRGLLIDVLTTGDVDSATRSLEVFLAGQWGERG